jgi:NAD(P)-dependent dehydrogenase (short-subunit alcohol dehydrogenase family)
VRVNAVCPAWVTTEMDVADQTAGAYRDADITGRAPVGRFASPDDVARAIAFLADLQESGYINGHALVVDGGWMRTEAGKRYVSATVKCTRTIMKKQSFTI